VAVLNTLNGEHKTAQEWAALGKIEYIAFPDALKGKYQSYTKADLTNLTMDGDYNESFATVEQGVANYVAQLQESI